MKKVLIASANPYSFCYAVENYLARDLAAAAKVDGLNLFNLCTRYSPLYNSAAKRLIVALNNNYARFVRSALSGDDLTSRLTIAAEEVPPLPETVEKLRSYKVNDCRVGLAALSSAATLTTITGVEETREYGRALESAWRAAHLSERVGREIANLGYDEIYIFNGRHCYSRPFCDAVARSSRLLRYEKGGTEDSFILSDRMIQHPANLADLIMSHDFSEEDGRAFFENRLTRAEGDPVNDYLGQQVTGSVPAELRGQPYVVFFTSSSDEFVALTDDAFLGEFQDQFDVAKAIATACERRGLSLVVRFHPHLLAKHPSWNREWDFEHLRARGVILLPANHPADSYELARGAKCVLSPGSTLGFECSYLGIPNAICGDWVGGYLGASVVVRNAADVARFIEQPRLPDNAYESALVYGSFYRRAGIRVPDYDIVDHPHRAKLGGRIVDPVRYLTRPLRQFVGL